MVDAKKKLEHAHPRLPHATVQYTQAPVLAVGAKVGTFLPVQVSTLAGEIQSWNKSWQIPTLFLPSKLENAQTDVHLGG